jgi:hypothetical protein
VELEGGWGNDEGPAPGEEVGGLRRADGGALSLSLIGVRISSAALHLKLLIIF